MALPLFFSIFFSLYICFDVTLFNGSVRRCLFYVILRTKILTFAKDLLPVRLDKNWKISVAMGLGLWTKARNPSIFVTANVFSWLFFLHFSTFLYFSVFFQAVSFIIFHIFSDVHVWSLLLYGFRYDSRCHRNRIHHHTSGLMSGSSFCKHQYLFGSFKVPKNNGQRCEITVKNDRSLMNVSY